jgi:hypothetical protein
LISADGNQKYSRFLLRPESRLHMEPKEFHHCSRLARNTHHFRRVGRRKDVNNVILGQRRIAMKLVRKSAAIHLLKHSRRKDIRPAPLTAQQEASRLQLKPSIHKHLKRLSASNLASGTPCEAIRSPTGFSRSSMKIRTDVPSACTATRSNTSPPIQDCRK